LQLVVVLVVVMDMFLVAVQVHQVGVQVDY
jgi:hypothetical protein